MTWKSIKTSKWLEQDVVVDIHLTYICLLNLVKKQWTPPFASLTNCSVFEVKFKNVAVSIFSSDNKCSQINTTGLKENTNMLNAHKAFG